LRICVREPRSTNPCSLSRSPLELFFASMSDVCGHICGNGSAIQRLFLVARHRIVRLERLPVHTDIRIHMHKYVCIHMYGSASERMPVHTDIRIHVCACAQTRMCTHVQECIRALGRGDKHKQFRGSKLTQVHPLYPPPSPSP
jgi:hypothetical protein